MNLSNNTNSTEKLPTSGGTAVNIKLSYFS